MISTISVVLHCLNPSIEEMIWKDCIKGITKKADSRVTWFSYSDVLAVALCSLLALDGVSSLSVSTEIFEENTKLSEAAVRKLVKTCSEDCNALQNVSEGSCDVGEMRFSVYRARSVEGSHEVSGWLESLQQLLDWVGASLIFNGDGREDRYEVRMPYRRFTRPIEVMQSVNVANSAITDDICKVKKGLSEATIPSENPTIMCSVYSTSVSFHASDVSGLHQTSSLLKAVNSKVAPIHESGSHHSVNSDSSVTASVATIVHFFKRFFSRPLKVASVTEDT
jgi:hypothetical protein